MSGLAFLYRAGQYFSLGAHGYQFYCTDAPVRYVEYAQIGANWCPGGSGLWIPAPSTYRGQPAPRPVGSLIQSPPEGSPHAWTYSTMPSAMRDQPGLPGLATAIQSCFKVKNVWQIQGIAEPVHYLTAVVNGERKVKKATIHSWTQQTSQIANLGVYMATLVDRYLDVAYDLAPGAIPPGGRVATQMPDADWPGEACRQVVTHSTFGTRTFFILVDASMAWHCWPQGAQLDDDLASSSQYADQDDKINIPSGIAKSVAWPYPSWVYRPPKSWRQAYRARGGYAPLYPRISWSFNTAGDQAIAVLVQRTPYSETYQTVDTTDELPTEIDSGIAPLIDSDRVAFGYEDGIYEPVQIDTLGLVELSLAIAITGPALTDFSFDVTISSESPPSGTAPLRIAAAYAMPLDWTKTGLAVQTDAVIEAWLTCYRHTDEDAFVTAMGGETGGELPNKITLSITANQQEVLQIPIRELTGRTDGRAYSGDVYATTEAKTTLSWLDLSSLSMIATATMRREWNDETPIETRSSGGGLSLPQTAYLRCADVGQATRIIGFGQVQQETLAGVEPHRISTWLNTPLVLTDQDRVIQPNETGNLRGKATSSSAQEAWWFTGPCLFRLMGELWRRYYAQYCWDDDEQSQQYAADHPADQEVQKGLGLHELTEANFIEEFLDRALSQQWLSQPPWPNDRDEYNVLQHGGVYDPIAQDYPGALFFTSAAPGIDPTTDAWKSQCAWLLWPVMVQTRALIATWVSRGEIVPAINTSSFDKVALALSLCLQCVRGTQVSSIALFNIASFAAATLWRLPNFPLGMRHYLYYLPLSISGLYGPVIAHPYGHLSWFHVADACPNRTMALWKRWTLDDNPDVNLMYDLGCGNPLNWPAVGGFDQALLDRVSWAHGQWTTTHIDAYNAAFNRTMTASDFYPHAEIYFPDASPNELFAEPGHNLPGYVTPLQHFGTEVNQKRSAVASGYYFDRRASTCYGRLSPLFF